jgi:pimeloyl-ACP methyl ester carboxylesterase
VSAVRRGEAVVAGVRSPYLEAGPDGADEAVVFVHGNPGPGRDFERLVARTGEFARAIAPDFPGFGTADKPKEFAYSVPGYGRHLAGILDQLGIQRAHLVLHDFGGGWGLSWAVDHPDRFASLTLINTGALLRYRWHRLARIWRTPVLGELFLRTANRRGFTAVMRRSNPPTLPDEFIDRMYEDAKDKGQQRAVLRLYRATDTDAFASLAPALRELQRPVLVVWGAQDPYIPVEQAHRQREIWPEARIVELPDSGHWPFADAPEQVEAAVLPFLREHVGAQVAA